MQIIALLTELVSLVILSVLIVYGDSIRLYVSRKIAEIEFKRRLKDNWNEYRMVRKVDKMFRGSTDEIR